jgi:hypothetical protein
MAAEKLQLKYVPLATLELWEGNPKRHDLDKLEASIKQFGFKDPPRHEPELNGGRGGVVEGNGRAQVLRRMQEAGQDPPRGIAVDKSGAWLAPVLFGVDAASEAEAQAYGVDHNTLTLSGGGFGIEDLLQVWDEEGLRQILETSPDVGDLLTSFNRDDLDALLTGPAFDPVGADDQSRLDRKKTATCPECGHEFTP